MLGGALFEAGRGAEAEAPLEREIANMPLDVEAPALLARTLEESGRRERAHAVLEAARTRWETTWRRFPGFAPIAIAYARFLADRMGDETGARAVVTSALDAATRDKDRGFLRSSRDL